MLPDTAASKVTAAHLSRTALLYVRQSSLKQVIHNTESAIRQYDLRGKAIALGWAADQITVIDIDQGQSGASAADREGFQQLVAEVSLGRAGIVLGLECSRLARNSADWHQLLELCGLTGTLICDEDGLYDPRTFNDRLLLGLKGALSEAELHFIRARLRGGIISKARRGELITPLPVGLAYDKELHVTARLIVRRVRDKAKTAPGQGELFPAWRYHAVFTDSPYETLQTEEQHRGHAIIEQLLADLSDGPLAHLPSGKFTANAAWLAIAAIAHNLVRAAGTLTGRRHAKARTATIRRDLIAIAARTARHGRGGLTLHLPEGWHREHEWASLFEAACGPPAAAA